MSTSHEIPSDHLPNLRDVGGWPTTSGGVVRPGALFRSAAPSDPGVPTDPAVTTLGLEVVVDMRTAAEAERRPAHLPRGARLVRVDILASTPGSLASLTGTLPAAIAEGRVSPDAFLADLDARAVMEHTYEQFVTEAPARAGFAEVARSVLSAGGRPTLLHCTAGKDRTGWAVAVLMAAVGSTRDAVFEEYLAVSPAVRALFAPDLERAAAVGLDAERLRPLLDVDVAYLKAALDRVDADFGGFDGYLRSGLGLGDDELDALRVALVDA
ncbi:tyrosine-protein phosphatase [Actinomyces provencensis]|uniref:tyrosine-protein phosphatase n=1 Tax=Actinomyces provencensis TaxID=1720198 RepID=UPI00096A8CCD|nr:tyrosine-protein phosphatase [Actinomyces provencensis]